MTSSWLRRRCRPTCFCSWSADDGKLKPYTWVSSAYRCTRKRWDSTSLARSAEYRRNSIGPRTDPWGTPYRARPRLTYIMLALKVALNLALISAYCFTALTETTFAPKPEVALRVYCVAVRSAILATAWLLVLFILITSVVIVLQASHAVAGKPCMQRHFKFWSGSCLFPFFFVALHISHVFTYL